MAKLLIADRDPHERTGIAWLVSSSPLNYEAVLIAATPGEIIRQMEAERPEVICLELDMIPREDWDRLHELIHHYRPKVIAMTAEATFERALQGIQLHAVDLWVKPQSPNVIRRVLARLVKEQQPSVRVGEEGGDVGEPAVSYRSLFLPQESLAGSWHLLLIQPENPARLVMLLHFLQDYPFRTPPALLPLSDVIVCLFSAAAQQAQTLEHLARQLLREWEAVHDEPLSLIIYEAEAPLVPLHEQYRLAKQALEIRFFKGYRQISLVKGKVDWQMIDPFLTPAEQRAWIEMLNDCDGKNIKQWMYQEFLNKTAPYPEPGLLRIRLTSILAQVRRFLKANCLDEGEIEVRYHQIFETILYTPILYRIVQEFLLFLNDVFTAARSNWETARTDVIEQAVRYMEERYAHSSLQLEDVARHVDRSPAYLSYLISKRTGSSFRQLLTAIRLKEAQRLLRETNLSIQEVAGQCGFDNANYFSRLFKARMGTSPRLFRNQKK